MEPAPQEGHTPRVGLLGGSFSPIHNGHLALAHSLCASQHLDELWFLVSPQNPLKQHEALWDDALRLQLVRAAIAGFPRFRVSDVEFHLPRPSYMARTLEELKRLYPALQFSLVIGSDNWLQFPLWHEHEHILHQVPILIYPRPGFPVDAAALPPHVQCVDAPLLPISSTRIRQLIQQGGDVRPYLPPAVFQLLQEKHLL